MKIFQNISDGLEVLSKTLSKNKNTMMDKLKIYLNDTDRKFFIYDTISFVLFYGIVFNLSASIIFGMELSILNALGCGTAYYAFIDIVSMLSKEKFILFRGDVQ